MRFILIENKNITEDILVFIVDFLNSHNVRVHETREYLTIFNDFTEPEDLKSFLRALANEYMISLKAYVSGSLQNTDNNKEIKIAKELLPNLPADIYDIKSLLLQSKYIENREEKLDLILKDTGVDSKMIKCLAENNFNVSLSSHDLYLHRNTINYKIDKLLSLTGFNIREFKDAYVLYSLIDFK